MNLLLIILCVDIFYVIDIGRTTHNITGFLFLYYLYFTLVPTYPLLL